MRSFRFYVQKDNYYNTPLLQLAGIQIITCITYSHLETSCVNSIFAGFDALPKFFLLIPSISCSNSLVYCSARSRNFFSLLDSDLNSSKWFCNCKIERYIQYFFHFNATSNMIKDYVNTNKSESQQHNLSKLWTHTCSNQSTCR